jgi:hypothetical protein
MIGIPSAIAKNCTTPSPKAYRIPLSKRRPSSDKQHPANKGISVLRK